MNDPVRWSIGLIGALVFSFPCWYLIAFQRDPFARHFATAIGKRVTVRLTDGSSLTLNTNTEITTKSTPQQLQIDLKKGELLCSMTENAVRNLVVTVDKTRITDVGTVFSVQRADRGVQVVVQEGVVLISEAGSPQVSLVRNQRALIDDRRRTSPAITDISPDEVTRRLSWQHGALVFKEEKLSFVLHEINRYNANIALAVTDPAIANRPFIGTIDPTDPVKLANGLQASDPSNVTLTMKRSPNGVLIYELQPAH